MRKILILPAIMLCLTAIPAFAAELIVDSKITKATVYSNRATVTRIANVNVDKGKHNILFENLPTSIMTDSLRVEGTSNAGVQFGAISHKVVYANTLTNPKEEKLNKQIQKLRDDTRTLDTSLQALYKKESFINNIGSSATNRINEDIADLKIDPENWNAAAEVIHEQTSAILRAKLAIDLNKRTINEEINKLQNELNQIRTNRRSNLEVDIPFEAKNKGKLKVVLSYQIPNAYWQPTYDARLNTEKGSLDLVQFGSVHQNTGEDWNNIELSLSTAQPHRGASLPNLSPHWINTYDPNKARYNEVRKLKKSRSFSSIASNESAGMFGGSAVMLDQAAAPKEEYAPPMKDTVQTTAQIETGGFTSEYKITGKSTVPSDGSSTKHKIGRFKTRNLLQVHIKPQLSDKAYLVSKVLLQGDAPILPGQVNLFRDNAFVGKNNLPLLRPDEEHPLFFGIDDKVSVKRKTLKDERKDAGIISRDNELTRYVVTEIQNLHNTAIDLVVKETIPVPQNDKISVKIEAAETTDGYDKDHNNIKGLLRWQFKLQPKAKKNVKVGWHVNWPKDKTISGL